MELRKNPTKEEARLWYQFLRCYPLRFRRQFQIGRYIVDFYCAKARLVVELDGSQHCEPDAVAYDKIRTQFLEEKGLYVLRLSNLDVDRQFRNVCAAIDLVVKERTMREGEFPSSALRAPSPQGEGIGVRHERKR